MKILLAMLGDLAGAQGGMEKVLCDMANNMFARGHEVTIVTYGPHEGKPYFYLDERVKYLNPGIGHKIKRGFVNLINIFISDRDKREARRHLYSCERMANRLQDLEKELETDVVVAYDKKSMIVFKDYLKTKAPVIAMFHFNPEDVLNNNYLNTYFEHADCIQVLMQSYIPKVREFISPKKIVHIPNVVPQYKDQSICENKIIINVARIEHNQKRQLLLVKAFNKIKEKFPDWEMQLWGDITIDKKYVSEIESYIKANKLSGNIKLCGSTKNIAEKLKQASIFAFPSAYEGFPLALTEAMSMGLPTVAYESCPAVNELVANNENGLLVDDGVDALAKGLVMLMDDIELRRRLGKQARLDMQAYAPEKIWDEWENLLSAFTSEIKK